MFVCGFAGANFGLGGTVVFLVGLNKQFSPQLNDRNDLGMCLQGFLVLLGAGPDCITGLVTRRNCDVYRVELFTNGDLFTQCTSSAELASDTMCSIHLNTMALIIISKSSDGN